MSGLYGLVHGQNPNADALLALLADRVDGFDGYIRFRDAWVEHDGDRILIRIHTRSGGGNRECYCDDYGDEHPRPDCIVYGNECMTAHPWYVRDADDDFDPTYADFYFAPDPAELEPETVRALVGLAGEPVDMGARWRAVIDAISGELGDSP